ncbi:MAG: hypothetical protein FWE16_02640 [Firmicutes bacterium]|nr:hypothetical protein [Bacillota bacterium]
MELKGIILYNKAGEVVGFVGLRSEEINTHIVVDHNFMRGGLVLSVNEYVFSLDKEVQFDVAYIDLNNEVFASIARKVEDDLEVLATGIINHGLQKQDREIQIYKSEEPQKIYIEEDNDIPTAVKEVDKILREACDFDENGITACQKCPYREEFFKFKAEA